MTFTIHKKYYGRISILGMGSLSYNVKTKDCFYVRSTEPIHHIYRITTNFC